MSKKMYIIYIHMVNNRNDNINYNKNRMLNDALFNKPYY